MSTPVPMTPVLIVEDDASLAQAVCQHVDVWLPGARCRIAPNLREALGLIATQDPPFALAVVDLSLPDTRRYSLDAVHAIYELAHDLPIIICTGQEQQVDVRRYGVRTWIVKGVRFWPALKQAIEEVCAYALSS